MIHIIVNGANGQMGQETVKAIENCKDLKLVAKAGSQDDLGKLILSTQADVVVDFTQPECVYQNARTILEQGARPVIGTTGLTSSEIAELRLLVVKKKLGAIIAPNFSVGAILMMRFAQEAARYLPNAEIIEMHHDKKRDAPSGTAIKTAELIKDSRTIEPLMPECKESIPGARGANYENIAIHSVRLPGFLAHQQVIFGGIGESLTIKHDSINRSCFMPGVVLACHKVMLLEHLVYGLEDILFTD